MQHYCVYADIHEGRFFPLKGILLDIEHEGHILQRTVIPMGNMPISTNRSVVAAFVNQMS